MAKKKLYDHHLKDREPNHASDHHDPSRDHGKDDSAETILRLRTLNAMLLKETTEKRRQVESLQRRKDNLEVEVRRMGADVKELEEELSKADKESVGLEVERSVMSCFLDAWRWENEVEVRRVVAEKEEVVRVARERVGEIGKALEDERGKVRDAVVGRDAAVTESKELVERARHLIEKLQWAEEGRSLVQVGLEVAKMENDRLGREKVEGEKVLQGLMKEKEAIEKELIKVGKEVGELRGKVEELERVNKEICREKKGKDMEFKVLEKEVVRLNRVETSLRKEEEKLQSRLFELESLCEAALENLKEREKEINVLSEENVAKEATILNLKGACNLLEKKLGMAEESLEGKARSIEEMRKRRTEMGELVDRNGKEFASLNREVAELKGVIAGLESSYRDQEDKSEVMLAEVCSCREALDGVKSKKDELEKLLAEERQNATWMASKLLEMERKIVETTEESRMIQGERDVLITEKTKVESKLSSCVEEKEMLEKRFSRAQQTTDDLEAKIKLAGIKYDQISMILKKTVVSLIKENGGEENSPDVQKLAEEDFQLYAKDLDAIKSAFRDKEYAVEELKQQLEIFKESASRAQKEKGLWTLLSSATTLVAAASVAYLARGAKESVIVSISLSVDQ